MGVNSLIILLIGSFACSSFAQRVAVTNIIPGDAIDNDGDGLIDEEYCYNGIDEDGDGLLNEDCAYLDICPLHGSTNGYEFVATFLDNQPDNSAYNPLTMFIGRPQQGSQDMFVNITSPLLLRERVRIPATTDIRQRVDGRGVMVDLPYQLRVTDSNQGVSQKTLHIHTSHLAAVQGYNIERYTADSFLTIPANALGREYFAATYVPSLLNTQVAVVGLYTNTTVNVSLIRDIGEPDTPRLMVFYHGVEYENGQSFLINVDPYQVVHVSSEFDMTGTRFVGDKPFAIFSGNLRTWVRDERTEAFIQSRDHLVEQIPPVETWGTRFVTRNYPPHKMADIMRVLVAKANTEVRVKISNSSGDFDSRFTLARPGMYRDFWLQPNAKASVWTSRRAMVAQYTHSQREDVVPRADFTDPSLIYVPPVDQFDNNYVFSTATYVGTDGDSFTNYVLLTAKDGQQYGITLDGQSLRGADWQLIEVDASGGGRAESFVQAYIRVNDGRHRLRSSSSFGAIQWSVGDRESVGSALGIRFGDSCVKCMQVVCGDSVDNDCDGQVDEERCDGIDNDGDGLVDEDCRCLRGKRQIYRHRTTTVPPPTTTTEPEPTPPTPKQEIKQVIVPHGHCTRSYDDNFQSVKLCYPGGANLQCPNRRAIAILSANLGRIGFLGEMSCGMRNPMNCEADDVACPYIDAYYTVARNCNGQQYCTVYLNDTMFQDELSLFPRSCLPEATYVDINYVCSDTISGQVPPCTFTPATRWLAVDRDMEITASSYASCLACGAATDTSCQLSGRSNCQPSMSPFAYSATQAWCPSIESPGAAWIQADLGAPYVVLGVMLQGRRRLASQFVQEVNIQVSSQPNSAFSRVITSASTRRDTFVANSNSSDIAWITFESNQTIARFVRIQVERYTDHPALHFEVVINNRVRGCEAFRALGTSLTGKRAASGEQHFVTCNGRRRTADGAREYTTMCNGNGKWSSEIPCD